MVKSMDFLEKQIRTLGFLITVFVAISLTYIMIYGHAKLNLNDYFFLGSLLLIMLCCGFGQIKFYQVTGAKYTLFTLPSLILGIFIAFYG